MKIEEYRPNRRDLCHRNRREAPIAPGGSVSLSDVKRSVKGQGAGGLYLPLLLLFQRSDFAERKYTDGRRRLHFCI
jgi:hypothetical protein